MTPGCIGGRSWTPVQTVLSLFPASIFICLEIETFTSIKQKIYGIQRIAAPSTIPTAHSLYSIKLQVPSANHH